MYAGQTVETGPVRAVLDDPAHPYTRLLLACHPDRADELAGIPGAVPSPLGAALGLPLPPALPAMRRPPAAPRGRRSPRIGDGREVACVLYGAKGARA